MTHAQWERMVAVVRGDAVDTPPVGFIADSPWIPGWAGGSILDYFVSDTFWMNSNRKVIRQFPSAMFVPGFWSEYGMCTEPSAFGAKCVWHEHDLPFAQPMIATPEQMLSLKKPDPHQDGLLPFMLRRLTRARPAIESDGHVIRFAVARGPLNIASFLMGSTEFLIALKEYPEASLTLLRTITDFLCDWIKVQAQAIPSIRGILLLDDLVGFLGREDIEQFANPFLKQAFEAIDSDVRFFHNDAEGMVCAPFLASAGVNLFNFSFKHSMTHMREALGPDVAMFGNLPPRDILAAGTPDDVRRGVATMKAELNGNFRGVIFSCGGGLPPGVSSANIQAFIDETATI